MRWKICSLQRSSLFFISFLECVNRYGTGILASDHLEDVSFMFKSKEGILLEGLKGLVEIEGSEQIIFNAYYNRSYKTKAARK